MPFQIIRQDITHMQVDAIVNPTNERLHPDGGTDAQIHRAAGPELALATAAIGHLDPGTAVITPAFRLPCRYVIHTAGPIWRDARSGEAVSLHSCYNLACASRSNTASAPWLSLCFRRERTAFPVISPSGSERMPSATFC